MSANSLKLLGTKIRDLRKAKGLSQEELGEKAGFHFSYIGGVERAEKNISILNLFKIASALDVGVHELFSYCKDTRSITIAKETEVQEIMDLLLQQEAKDLRKAKNVLKELFDK